MVNDLCRQLDFFRAVIFRIPDRVTEDELELAAVEGAHPSRVGVVRGQVVVVVPEMGEFEFSSVRYIDWLV